MKSKSPPKHARRHANYKPKSITNHPNYMDKVKIKRVKREHKKITAKEKILAGLGLGSSLLGGVGAVSPKPSQTQFVRTQENQKTGATGKIKQVLSRIFGVAPARAAGADVATAKANLDAAQKAYDEFNTWFQTAWNATDSGGWYDEPSDVPGKTNGDVRKAELVATRSAEFPGLVQAVEDAQAAYNAAVAAEDGQKAPTSGPANLQGTVNAINAVGQSFSQETGINPNIISQPLAQVIQVQKAISDLQSLHNEGDAATTAQNLPGHWHLEGSAWVIVEDAGQRALNPNGMYYLSDGSGGWKVDDILATTKPDSFNYHPDSGHLQWVLDDGQTKIENNKTYVSQGGQWVIQQQETVLPGISDVIIKAKNTSWDSLTASEQKVFTDYFSGGQHISEIPAGFSSESAFAYALKWGGQTADQALGSLTYELVGGQWQVKTAQTQMPVVTSVTTDSLYIVLDNQNLQSGTIQVTVNTDQGVDTSASVDVTSSDSNLAKVTKTGNQSFYVTVSKNTGTQDKTATITISCGGVSTTSQVIVHPDAAPAKTTAPVVTGIETDSPYVVLDSGGVSGPVNVIVHTYQGDNNSLPITVSGSDSSVAVVSTPSNGTFTVAAKKNTSGQQKTATITVSSGQVSTTVQVIVNSEEVIPAIGDVIKKAVTSPWDSLTAAEQKVFSDYFSGGQHISEIPASFSSSSAFAYALKWGGQTADQALGSLTYELVGGQWQVKAVPAETISPQYTNAQLIAGANILFYTGNGASQVPDSQLLAVRDSLLGQLSGGQIASIAPGSVLAYMLGWGTAGKANDTKTIDQQTYIFDGSNWVKQQAAATGIYTDSQLIADINTIIYTGQADIPNAQLAKIQPQISIPDKVTPGSVLAFMLGLGDGTDGITPRDGKDGKTYDLVDGSWSLHQEKATVAPQATGLSLDSSTVKRGGSYIVTFAGSNISENTYWEVRVLAPGQTDPSQASTVQWHQGTAPLTVNVSAGEVLGDYKIIGVRAYNDPAAKPEWTTTNAAITVTDTAAETVTKITIIGTPGQYGGIVVSTGDQEQIYWSSTQQLAQHPYTLDIATAADGQTTYTFTVTLPSGQTATRTFRGAQAVGEFLINSWNIYDNYIALSASDKLLFAAAVDARGKDPQLGALILGRVPGPNHNGKVIVNGGPNAGAFLSSVNSTYLSTPQEAAVAQALFPSSEIIVMAMKQSSDPYSLWVWSPNDTSRQYALKFPDGAVLQVGQILHQEMYFLDGHWDIQGLPSNVAQYFKAPADGSVTISLTTAPSKGWNANPEELKLEPIGAPYTQVFATTGQTTKITTTAPIPSLPAGATAADFIVPPPSYDTGMPADYDPLKPYGLSTGVVSSAVKTSTNPATASVTPGESSTVTFAKGAVTASFNFINTTSNSAGTYAAGDTWQLVITGAPANKAVWVSGAHNGQSFEAVNLGTTDSKGSITLSAALQTADIGVWQENWTVGDSASSGYSVGSLNFEVLEKRSSASSSTAPVITAAQILPAASVGQVYNLTLSADNIGSGAVWSVIGSALPKGLSLNASTGVISGTPTAAGAHQFTIQVKYNNQTYAKGFGLNVGTAYSNATTAAINKTIFKVGEEITVIVQGRPNANVYVTQGGSGAATRVGSTDSIGQFVYKAILTGAEVGNWTEDWKVGLDQQTAVLARRLVFTVKSAAATSTFVFTNDTNATARTFAAEDKWKAVISGAAANKPVWVIGTHNGQSFQPVQIGRTNAQGGATISARLTAGDAGEWQEFWVVGDSAASGETVGSVSFSVAASRTTATLAPRTYGGILVSNDSQAVYLDTLEQLKANPYALDVTTASDGQKIYTFTVTLESGQTATRVFHGAQAVGDFLVNHWQSYDAYMALSPADKLFFAAAVDARSNDARLGALFLGRMPQANNGGKQISQVTPYVGKVISAMNSLAFSTAQEVAMVQALFPSAEIIAMNPNGASFTTVWVWDPSDTVRWYALKFPDNTILTVGDILHQWTYFRDGKWEIQGMPSNVAQYFKAPADGSVILSQMEKPSLGLGNEKGDLPLLEPIGKPWTQTYFVGIGQQVTTTTTAPVPSLPAGAKISDFLIAPPSFDTGNAPDYDPLKPYGTTTGAPGASFTQPATSAQIPGGLTAPNLSGLSMQFLGGLTPASIAQTTQPAQVIDATNIAKTQTAQIGQIVGKTFTNLDMSITGVVAGRTISTTSPNYTTIKSGDYIQVNGTNIGFGFYGAKLFINNKEYDVAVFQGNPNYIGFYASFIGVPAGAEIKIKLLSLDPGSYPDTIISPGFTIAGQAVTHVQPGQTYAQMLSTGQTSADTGVAQDETEAVDNSFAVSDATAAAVSSQAVSLVSTATKSLKVTENQQTISVGEISTRSRAVAVLSNGWTSYQIQVKSSDPGKVAAKVNTTTGVITLYGLAATASNNPVAVYVHAIGADPSLDQKITVQVKSAPSQTAAATKTTGSTISLDEISASVESGANGSRQTTSTQNSGRAPNLLTMDELRQGTTTGATTTAGATTGTGTTGVLGRAATGQTLTMDQIQQSDATAATDGAQVAIGGTVVVSLQISKTGLNMQIGDTATVGSEALNNGVANRRIVATATNNNIAVAVNSSTGIITVTALAVGDSAVIVHPTDLPASDTSQDKTITVRITGSATAVLAATVDKLEVSDSATATGLQMSADIPQANGANAAAQTYKVKKGDTLFSIAQKVYGKGNGKQWRKILSQNPNCLRIQGNTKTLKIGAVLVIPRI